MLSNWKLAAVLAVASVVSACGGGTSDPTPRGAIAIDPSNGFGTISLNFTSQVEANSDAVYDCGSSSCVVVLEFSGNGECGSIARGSNGVWGVARGGSKEVADRRAYDSCVSRGGSSCVIPTWVNGQCN